MNKSDILKLAEFLNNKELKEFSNGSIMFHDKFKKFREWRPDKNIEDAWMLVEKIKLMNYYIMMDYYNIFDFGIAGNKYSKYIKDINKDLTLAICNAVLKLIKDGK